MAQMAPTEARIAPDLAGSAAQPPRRGVAKVFGKPVRWWAYRITAYTFMTAMSVVFAIPLLWMLSTSLKSVGETFIFPPRWIPSSIQWSNFPEIFRQIPFARYIGNTLWLILWNTIGTVLANSLVAYAFARLRFRGKRVLFMILIATLMIPWTVLMIPTFVMFHLIEWYDTYLPLIVPAFFASPFNVFFMRQFMMTIPLELDEAARIDGAGRLRTLFQVLLPLCKPILAIMVIGTFTGIWNDVMGPLIYLEDPSKYTVAIGITMFHSSRLRGTEWNLLMAASLMATVPLLIIYYFGQDYLIGGIASVGLKG
jgi:ABC-type glycerol-3-phosphate transport system permease component